MNPPLRSVKDREAVLEGVTDCTLEILCSDHAPPCDFEKRWSLITRPLALLD